MEIRCAVGPGSVLLARTSDPAEDPRPRPRRHTVPVNGNASKSPSTLTEKSAMHSPSCTNYASNRRYRFQTC